MENKTEIFLTSKEAADLLGVTQQTIQLWEEKEILRGWKTPGGHRRIALSSVENLLDQRSREMAGSHPDFATLLVVEDDPDMLELYRRGVQAWGIPVRLICAENGYDGLIQIGKEKLDMIILDLVMPHMDGFQLLCALSAKPDLQHLHLVVVTALSTQEIAAQGGVPDHVMLFSKPIHLNQLERHVRAKLFPPWNHSRPGRKQGT